MKIFNTHIKKLVLVIKDDIVQAIYLRAWPIAVAKTVKMPKRLFPFLTFQRGA